ncbi:MAG: hypothetical protein ACLPVY_06450 [Acidimicrobiia bacterium]
MPAEVVAPLHLDVAVGCLTPLRVGAVRRVEVDPVILAFSAVARLRFHASSAADGDRRHFGTGRLAGEVLNQSARPAPDSSTSRTSCGCGGLRAERGPL